MFFYDDGVSGTTFERPGFKEMEAMVEAGKVSTIIVKDLSRFGRNYLEVGRYLEIVYPTLGVKFIAIQENVDTLAGTGTEMMPFHNIFNEWYASQTSKKIRAVWAMKAANGKRVSPTVPYGYVENILANRQYTGCAVNFKTTSVSYKVHKTVYKPEEEWQIIPDMQEPIIDENTWLRVQELRKNKRRPTATGRKSLFSGLIFCPGLRREAAFLRSQEPEAESGVLPLRQL